MTRLTLRRLNAMENAVSAMLAHADNEGDWQDDVTRKDLDCAHDWIIEQIKKRDRKALGGNHE